MSDFEKCFLCEKESEIQLEISLFKKKRILRKDVRNLCTDCASDFLRSITKATDDDKRGINEDRN